MVNVWNENDVTRYLYDVAEGDETLGRYLDMALHRALLKEDTLSPVTSLPPNAPEWMRQKWPDGGPYYEFVPDEYYHCDVEHVADWIKAAIVNDEPWLRQVDAKGKPLKLGIGTLQEAVAKADKAIGSVTAVTEKAGDTNTVMDFGDGFAIVHLLTAQSLDYETRMLRHCIGHGAYDAKLHNSGRAYFSLRKENVPLATVEVDSEEMTAYKGRGNSPPAVECMPYIKAFLESEQFDLLEAPSHTGLIKVGHSYHSVLALPANLNYPGNLNLSGTPITALPPGLRVRGNLNLSGTGIRTLPDDLQVGGKIIGGPEQTEWAGRIEDQRRNRGLHFVD